MSPLRLFALTALALVAFAANSILCRLALRETAIDAATFTSVRIVSGALALALISSARTGSSARGGDWLSAAALFAYAACFSFAYRELTAGSGALLLFGAVQVSMILWGWRRGERPSLLQAVGLVLALAGLVGLVLPGLAAPPPLAATSMGAAGVAWGIYSLRGRGARDPLAATAGNFLRAAPLALGVSAILHASARFDSRGAVLALTSGALTSGVGYAIWYAALRGLDATRAATVQLCVPMLAAIAGVVFLAEPLTARLAAASFAILGGIGLVILARGRRNSR